MTSGRVTTESFPLTETVVTNGDASLRVIEQGDGPAVLFCHGFPETADTWRSQMLAVARAGYRAVALDMRGHGASSAPEDPFLYTSLHTVGDLIAVLDALDIATAVVVGHDWGADHAQRAAVMRPDRIRAIVSMSIPFAPRGPKSHWDALREEGLGDRYYALDMLREDADSDFPPTSETVASILYWLSASPAPDERWDPIDHRRSMLRPAPTARPTWIDPDYLDRLVDSVQRNGFRGGLNHYRAAQASFELTAAFRDAVITQPSLYVWGAEDGLSRFFHPEPPPLAELRRAQPALVGQIRLEGVGHWIHQEAPNRLNAAIVDFLDRLDGIGGLDDPVMIASGLGRREAIEALLAADADVSVVEPTMGATALHKAAQSGDPMIIAQLLDHGAFIDQQSPVIGHTPLMDAVQHKRVAAVSALLARGARLTPRNHFQQTALDLAEADGLVDIAELIRSAERETADRRRSHELAAAVLADSTEDVRRLLARGADLDERLPLTGGPDDDYTPLGLAARDGRDAILRLLLEAGADVRQLNGLMRATPAHEAAYAGHADVIRTLTDGPWRTALDLDAQGAYNGLTALHDAVWHGHFDAVQALVGAGAALNLRTHTGVTPRELALTYGYDRIAALLKSAEEAH